MVLASVKEVLIRHVVGIC